MATVAYRIVSHYTPPPEEADASEQAVADDLLRQEYTWNAGPSFGERSHRATHPPKFVSASDLSSVGEVSAKKHSEATNRNQGSQISGWYRSLRAEQAPPPSTPTHPPPSTASSHSSPQPLLRPTTTPSSSWRPIPHPKVTPKPKTREPDWFINAALRSSPKIITPPVKPPSSMADILSRAPPPLANEAPFVPSVRTLLGPSNRGYAILQQSGWREGEGLGSWRKGKEVVGGRGEIQGNAHPANPNHNIAVSIAASNEIIDLTLSSDDSSDSDFDPDDLPPSPPPILNNPASSSEPNTSTILLAPLPTYLKVDRLGIGSKLAGKVKPLRRTADALDANIRRGEIRARAARAKELEILAIRGRGSKGLARKHKREEQKRRDMIAYMNS